MIDCACRRYRFELPLDVHVATPDEKTTRLIESASDYLAHVAGVASLTVQVDAPRPPKSAVSIAGDCRVYVPLEGLVDIDEELGRLDKAMAKLDKEIGKLEGKLSNERFIANAPEEVVAKDRGRLEEAKAQRATYAESAQHLRG